MYVLTIALRYLARRRIAYVSIIAIAFGVAGMIVVSSVMSGFQRRIVSSIRSVDGDVAVALNGTFERKSERHFEMVAERLSPFTTANGGPVAAYSPRVMQHAMISTTAANALVDENRGPRQDYVQLLGIDPVLERRVLPFDEMLDAVKDVALSTTLPEEDTPRVLLRRRMPESGRERPFEYTPEGQPFPSDHPGIILGSMLADRLDVGVGDKVKIITARNDIQDAQNVEFVEERFVVTGCFQSGRYDYDLKLAFCEADVIKELLDLRNACTEVRVRLTDAELADDFKMSVRKRYGSARGGLDVWTWKEQMKPLADALAFEKLAMLIVLSAIIAVAGAGSAGILYMVVLEKTRDIGILQSMGATSRGLVGVFMIYGGMLGLLGTGLGVWLGLSIVDNLEAIIRQIEKWLDVDLFPQDVYEFASLPTHYETGDIVKVAAFTMLWCLIASAIPALRAAFFDPLKCLVHE